MCVRVCVCMHACVCVCVPACLPACLPVCLSACLPAAGPSPSSQPLHFLKPKSSQGKKTAGQVCGDNLVSMTISDVSLVGFGLCHGEDTSLSGVVSVVQALRNLGQFAAAAEEGRK